MRNPCRPLNHRLRYPGLDAVSLSRNQALVRFEQRVEHPKDLTHALSAVRETLSTISSPVFSELTFKLEGFPMETHFFLLLCGDIVWEEGWGMVDRDLDDMVHSTGRDIRLVVQLGEIPGTGGRSSTLREIEGGITLRGFGGHMFPLMNARGLVEERTGGPMLPNSGERSYIL